MKYILLALLFASVGTHAQKLYTVPKGVETNWSSFENITSSKGRGGIENKGAKGHAFEIIKASESRELLYVNGPGIIQRIWLTVNERAPETLRSIRLDMYWDGESKPAVSVPLSDFFGVGLGRTIAFESALFTNPEGRSFNCYIPMPFKKGARVVLTNESQKILNLFYDINWLKVKKLEPETLYFHAYWSSNEGIKLGEDFAILPRINGKGRFLGCNVGVITNPVYGKSWWGEGEVKMYLDGDKDLPTLVGTGTEDYIGTAWGQGKYMHQYQGCTIADEANGLWAYYRYHVPDPVYFKTDCKVVIQQIGGDNIAKVKEMANANAPLIPVTVARLDTIVKLLELTPTPKLTDSNFPDGWTNFYRLDHYSATAYFYLNKPASNLPALPPPVQRTKYLAQAKK